MVRRLGDTVPILAVRAPDATQASGVVEWMRYTGGNHDRAENTQHPKHTFLRTTGTPIEWQLTPTHPFTSNIRPPQSPAYSPTAYSSQFPPTPTIFPVRPCTEARKSTNAIAGSSRHANALMPSPFPPYVVAHESLLSMSILSTSAHVIFLDICPAVLAFKTGPLVQTANYTSFSNNTLHDKGAMKSKAFNRIIQVWLENTDFVVHCGVDTDFRVAHEQGILFIKYNAVTHPSEPNYVAAMDRDFFRMNDDNMYHIPSNISTIVDLLEAKQVSWERRSRRTCPQMRFTAQVGFGLFLAFSVSLYRSFSYAAPNHGDPSAAPYTYYVRKRSSPSPYIAHSDFNTRFSLDPKRAGRILNFDDFANDVVNRMLPQWVFVTPNMIDDAYDTTIDFAASFLEYWLLPLLSDPHTSPTYELRSLAGGTVPLKLRGTTDDTLYTHYSTLSTVQASWGLGSLGRQDINASISNAFDFVAKKTGCSDVHLNPGEVPQSNLTGVVAGALKPCSVIGNFSFTNFTHPFITTVSDLSFLSVIAIHPLSSMLCDMNLIIDLSTSPSCFSALTYPPGRRCYSPCIRLRNTRDDCAHTSIRQITICSTFQVRHVLIVEFEMRPEGYVLCRPWFPSIYSSFPLSLILNLPTFKKSPYLLFDLLSCSSPLIASSAAFIPFTAPNIYAKGAGGGPVSVRPDLNTVLTVTQTYAFVPSVYQPQHMNVRGSVYLLSVSPRANDAAKRRALIG
ncbi:hypothetical protein C8R44DRAFT_869218 [Mycena epipterygia]|nr:hypothetical protein C8R44DRAFT_869218 [Mycena epipterygia]